MAKPGWGAKLEGHPVDLDTWTRVLADPYVEKIERADGTLVVLRATALAGLNSADEVRKKALPLIERLNGALLISDNAEPVHFAAVVNIDDNGDAGVHHSVVINTTLRGISMVATGIVGKEAAVPVIAPPAKPQAHVLVELAAGDKDVASLLAQLSRADNWYDLYKTIELAGHLVGSEHDLIKMPGIDGAALKRARTAANTHRHARAHELKEPMTLSQAKAIVVSAVRQVLTNRPGPEGSQ